MQGRKGPCLEVGAISLQAHLCIIFFLKERRFEIRKQKRKHDCRGRLFYEGTEVITRLLAQSNGGYMVLLKEETMTRDNDKMSRIIKRLIFLRECRVDWHRVKRKGVLGKDAQGPEVQHS